MCSKLKILILPLYGLGDTLMMTPALQILKEQNKLFQIDVLTLSKTNYEILKNNPYIDNLLFFPFLQKGKLKSLIYFAKHFSFKYDIVINFFPSNRKEYNILSFLTFARKRIGHKYLHYNFKELNSLKNLTVSEDDNLHNVEENINLLRFLGIKEVKTVPNLQIFLTQDEEAFGNDFLKKYTESGDITIGIHPGCSKFKNHNRKRLPIYKWVKIVNHYGNYKFFVFGTDEEKEELEEIRKKAKSENVKVIRNTDIRKVAAIIKRLNLFLSNDSGLMHLAAAVKTPVIAVFGPTNPVWVKPWKVKHEIIRREELDCIPCFVYSPKPLSCKYGDFRCLNELDENKIIEKIGEFINYE